MTTLDELKVKLRAANLLLSKFLCGFAIRERRCHLQSFQMSYHLTSHINVP